MAEIVLDNVTKRYPRRRDGGQEADFTIADGEFIILVGPSGCGKSHRANMIVGPRGHHRRRAADRRRRSSTTWPRRTATSRWCSRATRSTRT